MDEKKPATKKPAARKPATKKPAARKRVTNKVEPSVKKDNRTAAQKSGYRGQFSQKAVFIRPTAPVDSEITEIAEQILSGGLKWGSGRDLDERIRMAGYDPDIVRKEVYRLRFEYLTKPVADSLE